MAVNLSPVGGVAAQFFDNSGQVLTGGKLYSYLAGTTTPAATYTTNSGLVANSNPIILNAAGRVADSGEIWLTDSVNYKFVLQDQNSVQIAVWDNVTGINSNFINYVLQEQTFTATQGQTIFTLTGGLQYTVGTNNLAVFVNGSKQIVGTNYTETSATTFTFVNGLNVGDIVDAVLSTTVATNVTNAVNVAYNPPYTSSVVTNVQTKLGEFLSIKDFGAKCDGTTDDTSAVQTAITSLGATSETLLIPGSTKISSNLTFGANTQLWFQQGAKFVGVAGTEVITVQKQIIAGLGQIFQTCSPISTTGMTICPEWFGAVKDGTTDDLTAFQKALSFLQNVGGLVQLQAGYYAISDQLNISYNRITIQGAGNNVTYFKVTGTNKNGIKINGTSSVSTINNIMLRDFSIILATAATATSFGLDLNFAVFPIIERIQVQDFLYGVRMEGATNSQLTKVGATYSGSTNGFIGFSVYGGASGATSANASSILKDCYASGVSGLTGQIGFRLYGVYMSDVQFDTCETALTNYGYSLDYSTAPNYNVDIIIRNPIVDRYFTQGILVNALPSNGVLQIIGGYTNPNTLGAAAQNIYLSSCVGAINVIGHEFIAPSNIIYTDGLYMLSCTGVTISNNLFSTLNKGVYASSCGYCVISGNIFRGGNPSAFTKMIDIIGGTKMMVNGNSFNGATLGVSIDATSDACGIVGNTANVSTVGTRYSNLGTNPIGGANGSTGLNSGV